MLRRHPAPVDLGAWFDGEATKSDVGAHVARCSRCRRRVSEMGHVRAWIRAQPFFSMGDDGRVTTASSPPGGPAPPGSPAWEGRPGWPGWKAVAVAAAVLGAFLFRPSVYGGDGMAVRRAAQEAAERRAAPEPSAPAEPGSEPPATEAPEDEATPRPTGGSKKAPSRPEPGLRLGLVVPRVGPLAAEGAEIVKVVKGRVNAANAAGGIGGRPVSLVVVPAEDKAAVAGLGSRVSALVGGFGADAPRKGVWLLPADANVSGPNVVASEVSPHAAGSQVGSLLAPATLGGPVGVVRGTGPEAAMEAGVAARARTATVAAAGTTSCEPEVSALRQAGALAMVVAGDPDLAARCLRAALRVAWRPPLGTFLPPSSAYARLDAMPEALGASTVLALPWPTSAAQGAARFRATARSTSYRAMVSFAAAELAIDIARQQGSISMDAVSSSRWRSDLLDLRGTAINATLVVAAPNMWLPARGLSVPLSPLGIAAP